jgi:pimeloyl-ACP methyl ester carboxylesterase
MASPKRSCTYLQRSSSSHVADAKEGAEVNMNPSPARLDPDLAAPFRRPPDRWIAADHGEVAYRRFGSGPDVLFVHGWPVTGATFRSLIPHLAPHVTCHVIDLPGAGDSRFTADTPVSIANHVRAVVQVVDALGLASVAVVGHDSGGLIARHALGRDPRLRALGLVNTEHLAPLSWRFRAFLLPRFLPGFGALLGWAVGQRGLRRNKFLLGDAFVDPSRLDGEFDELFLQPLHRDPRYLRAAIRILRSFDLGLVRDLAALHADIRVPVHMVWGDQGPFFPLQRAKEMAASFPSARLHVVEGGGLFVHEERPEEVARALLPTLVGETPRSDLRS